MAQVAREPRSRADGVISAVAAGLLIGLAGVLPLIVLPATLADDTDVLPKVLVTRVVLVMLAALWAARALLSRSLRIRRSVLDLPVLAIVGSAALSTILSVNPVLSVYGSYTRYEGLLTAATYALLFWFTVQFIESSAWVRVLLRAMLAGAAVECVIACSQTIVASAGNDLSVFGESATTFDGVARALGTMGNANNLAIWLAMLIPVAFHESLAAQRARWRLLAAGELLLMLVTLILTFGRAAWIGAAAGLVVVAVLLSRRAAWRRSARSGILVLGLAVALLGGAALAAQRLGVPVVAPALSRLASLADPAGGSGGVRLHLYGDTIAMVSQRPLVGFGPDTFGLVYPSRATGDVLPGVIFDKAHSDILQVAATQGVLGAAADLWAIGALLVVLIRHRHAYGLAAVLGAVVAYQVAIQLNFAWFPVTAPYWVIAGVAVVLAGPPRVREWRLPSSVAVRAAAAAAVTAAMITVFVVYTVLPAVANTRYAEAQSDVQAGHRAAAMADIANARAADPQQSEYAAYQGDLEAALVGDRPGPGANLPAARRAYQAALDDGTIFPGVAIRLAFVDIALGDQRGALAAAQYARALEPSGPAAQLVRELGG